MKLASSWRDCFSKTRSPRAPRKTPKKRNARREPDSPAPVTGARSKKMRVDTRHSAKLFVCLAAVYLIWGSSFLFTKIAVGHLPIALFSAVRFLTAGTVLALVARYGRGK